jgi:ribonuclease HI
VKQHDDIESGTIYIYTDGSGINSYISAAAVAPALQISGIRTTKMEYIGISTTSTVYSAELRGLVLALRILLDIYVTVITPEKCTIFTDNQAAIQAIRNPKCPSGQYILIKAVQLFDKARNLG